MPSLKDKIIWITGASSGIGEGIVQALGNEKVNLILSSRRKEALQTVKANYPHPERVKILPLDLAKPDTLEAKANEAIAMFGRVDIVIHSGGISQRAFAMDTQEDVTRKLLEINFISTTIITRALLPTMIQNGFGQIVPISSLVGKFGTPYRSSYAASKHALHGYYDSLRAELWRKNIFVTIITPGLIKTNVSLNALTEQGEAANVMDQGQAKGISAFSCGKQIVKAIKKQKEEVRIGGKETLAILLKRYFPRLFSRIIRKANVR